MLEVRPKGLIQLPAWPAARRLGEIGVPTLAIWGDRDLPEVGLVGERLVAGVPGARRVVLHGVDHFVPMRAPDPFAREVLAFLDKAAPVALGGDAGVPGRADPVRSLLRIRLWSFVKLTLNKLLLKGSAAISLPVPGRQKPRATGPNSWSPALAAAPVTLRGGRSGGSRPGRWLGGGVAPQLEQVMGAAQQLPLRLAGTQAAAQEPPGTLVFLDLPEHRLHGLAALGVAGLAVLALELGGHGGAEPVASGCRGLAVLARLALPAVPGRRDQQLGRVWGWW